MKGCTISFMRCGKRKPPSGSSAEYCPRFHSLAQPPPPIRASGCRATCVHSTQGGGKKKACSQSCARLDENAESMNGSLLVPCLIVYGVCVRECVPKRILRVYASTGMRFTERATTSQPFVMGEARVLGFYDMRRGNQLCLYGFWCRGS